MKYLAIISKAGYVVDVCANDKGKERQFVDNEIRKNEEKIRSAKIVLRTLMSQLAEECAEDKVNSIMFTFIECSSKRHLLIQVFHELAKTDEDDMIDVNDVVCSKCGLDTFEDAQGICHDIVLCDRKSNNFINFQAQLSVYIFFCLFVTVALKSRLSTRLSFKVPRSSHTGPR
jgi:hypothetical protein